MNPDSGKFNNQYRISTTRMNGWDYSASGWYFVTICTRARNRYFGVIQEGDMHRSALGEIAHRNWLEIPNHFPLVSLEEFVIMPDHVHGIIVINPVETQHAASLPNAASLQDREQNEYPKQKGEKPLPKSGSLSSIIRSYKSAVTHWAGENGYTDFGWQARFFDRIIRDEASLANIRLYIIENPQKWAIDERYPQNIER